MKEFCGTFTAHLKRGIISPMFLVCTALCTALFLVFVSENDMLDPSKYRNLPGLHYFLDQADNRGATYFIMMLTAFPGALMFYEDWKSGNFKFIISRAGRGNYAFAVTLAAGITAAAVMIITYIIFSAIILSRFPVISSDQRNFMQETIGFPNGGLLRTGHILLCYFLYFLTRGAMAAFFAMSLYFSRSLSQTDILPRFLPC